MARQIEFSKGQKERGRGRAKLFPSFFLPDLSAREAVFDLSQHCNAEWKEIFLLKLFFPVGLIFTWVELHLQTEVNLLFLPPEIQYWVKKGVKSDLFCNLVRTPLVDTPEPLLTMTTETMKMLVRSAARWLASRAAGSPRRKRGWGSERLEGDIGYFYVIGETNHSYVGSPFSPPIHKATAFETI